MIPDPEQVHRLSELMPERLAASVNVAVGCGLRLGVVLGWRWVTSTLAGLS